jgi:hypothetical protein
MTMAGIETELRTSEDTFTAEQMKRLRRVYGSGYGR